jgi:hypothetical protein
MPRYIFRIVAGLAACFAAAPPAHAQMTADEKAIDFQTIAAPYAKWYAPYEWKRDVFGYDAMNLAPWIAEARATTNDLDYYGVVVRYTTQLQDSHARYRIPSSFYATLGLHVDAFFDEGRKDSVILIDGISRGALPATQYPFQIGDELVSIDGVPVATLIASFTPYVNGATAEERMRVAAYYLTVRAQSVMPRAHEIGDYATLVVKRQSGATGTYLARWYKYGVPITTVGPARPLKSAPVPRARTASGYRNLFEKFGYARVQLPVAILNYGGVAPVWEFPSSFQQRLGTDSYDEFTSGVMVSEGYRIGYLRIPAFEVITTEDEAFDQLDNEIQYLQGSTDALVLDIMRNPGGYTCYGEDVTSRFMTGPWRAVGIRLRVSWDDYAGLLEEIEIRNAIGYDPAYVAALRQIADEMLDAYRNNRLTAPIGVCGVGLERQPAAWSYTKPILLLTDEFSASAADSFAAVFQDNQRGKVFGHRTNGAGGSVVGESVGFYSESGYASFTNSLMYRPNAVDANGFTNTHTVENVGVQPDIPYDYMRPETLRGRGRPFVDAFLAEIASELRAAGIAPSLPVTSSRAAGRPGAAPPGPNGQASGGVR